MTMIYAIHDTDQEKLEGIIEEMKSAGAPAIRVVDCGDYYMALEGSHRLAAASALGIEPDLTILDQDDVIDISEFDWFESANWDDTEYPAGEVAGELYSVNSVPYMF